jgi:hypothetical protein
VRYGETDFAYRILAWLGAEGALNERFLRLRKEDIARHQSF